MVTREEYSRAVRKYFGFLEEKFGYVEVLKKIQSSTLYDVEYTNNDRIISISYEIMGEGVAVVIFRIINGIRSDYDDYANTLHLNRIIKDYKQSIIVTQLKSDETYFKSVGIPHSTLEAELLKKAKLLSGIISSSAWV